MTGRLELDVCAICARGLDSTDGVVHAWNVAADHLEDAAAARRDAIAALRLAAVALDTRSAAACREFEAAVRLAMRAAICRALAAHDRRGWTPTRAAVRLIAMAYLEEQLDHALDVVAEERRLMGAVETA